MSSCVSILPFAYSWEAYLENFDNLIAITKAVDKEKWECPRDGSRNIQAVEYFNLSEIVMHCRDCKRMFAKAVMAAPIESTNSPVSPEESKIREK